MKNPMTKKLIEEVRRTGTAMVGEKQNLEDCEKLLALPVLAVTHLTTVFNNVPRWMENLRKATWEKLVKRGLEHWSTHIGNYKKEFEKFPSRSAAERSTAIEDMQTCESSLGGLANVLGKRVPELSSFAGSACDSGSTQKGPNAHIISKSQFLAQKTTEKP